MLLLIFICIAIGALLRSFKKIPRETPQVLNSLIIYVSLPAFTLFYLRGLSVNALWPAAMPWIFFAASFLFFSLLGRLRHWDRKSIGTLIICAGLGNTSFLGFPLIEAMYGAQGLKIAVVIDQLGSFLLLSTAAVFVANWFGNEKPSSGSIIRRMFSFPPFIAFLAALALQSFAIPSEVEKVLEKIGGTLIPLALISIGFQWKVERAKLTQYFSKISLGLLFKLILGPALIFFTFLKLFHFPKLATDVTLMESAMAPMITASVIITEFGLDENLGNLVLGLGIPLSFITLFAWKLLV